MASKTRIKDETTDYAKRVVAGKILTSNLVKLSCQRHLDDLKRGDVFFDVDEAQECFWFIGTLKQWKGEFSGEPLDLHPFQKFIIGSIVGWKRKSDGLRRFRVAYIELPRKNGKTTLAAGLALYMLMYDGEAGAECYAVATKEDQAKLVWKDAWQMFRRNPHLNRFLKKTSKAITFEKEASSFVPLGSDSDTQDGLNPHFAVFDELHKWKRKDLWSVIEEGMGARRQPVIMVITTAGNNTHGVCYEQRSHVERILTQKSYIDDTYFAYCAGLDAEDLEVNWTKPKYWRKANPLLGAAKKEGFLRAKCNVAKKIASERDIFQQFQLNVWVKASRRWLDVLKWEKLTDKKWKPEQFEGRECYLGVDLSSHKDLTAAVWIFPPEEEGEKMFFYPRFYMPEARIEERIHSDKVPFDQWQEEGWLTALPGETVNYDLVRQDINIHRKKFELNKLGIDPFNAAGVGAQMQEEDGIELFNVRQGFLTMNQPCKYFEVMILDKTCQHDGNPIMSWCIDNVVTSMDPAGNLKPDKKKSNDVQGAATKRIDGVSALLTGLTLWIDDFEESNPGLTILGQDEI